MLHQIHSTPVDQLTELVLELLDAHADTVALAQGLELDLEWAAHLDYLRDLQRVARGSLSHLGEPGPGGVWPPPLNRRAAA